MDICHYTYTYSIFISSRCDFFLGGKLEVEWDGNPMVLSPLLLLHGAKEDEEQLWALINLLGKICIVSLDTVSSFFSSFLKGI